MDRVGIMNKEESKRVIEEFIKSREKTKKFIEEELDSIRSPLRDKLKNKTKEMISA